MSRPNDKNSEKGRSRVPNRTSNNEKTERQIMKTERQIMKTEHQIMKAEHK